MTFLAFILLLSFLPAGSAKSLNPVFGPQQVYGLIDGSVNIKCFYPPTTVNRHDRKYWCRESSRSCVTVVSTSGYTARGYQGRIAITDFPEQGVMLINISQLALADRGTYQCGVGINGKGLSNKVKLDISEGNHSLFFHFFFFFPFLIELHGMSAQEEHPRAQGVPCFQGPDVPEEAELFYVELHGSVSMSCDFGKDYASTRKFLCKMEKSGCRNIVDTYGEIDSDFQGRILLSNDNTEGAFSIMITQVDWEDAGLYLCGADAQRQQPSEDLGKGKAWQTPWGRFWQCQNGPLTPAPRAPPVKGSSATIDCHYDPTKNYSLKYLCKWRTTGCARIIDNTGFLPSSYEGRVAMFDNPKNGTFSIVLNQLRSSDEGFYWCMTNDHRERKRSVELTIIEGEPGLTGKEEVQAEVGSRVDLTCSYSCKYYSYEKYWCKWSRDGCTPLTASDQSQPELDVSCDAANKTLILSLDSVTVEDQGWYWCGVRRNGHYGETMAVSLQVDGGEPQGTKLRGWSTCWEESSPCPLGCSTSKQKCSQMRTGKHWEGERKSCPQFPMSKQAAQHQLLGSILGCSNLTTLLTSTTQGKPPTSARSSWIWKPATLLLLVGPLRRAEPTAMRGCKGQLPRKGQSFPTLSHVLVLQS
uniref:Polymeric immunoglobulin receptor n=1 Tax=Pavo cristatus TaxID=9049 RepID=A0A8C9EZY2_PAVCR